MTFKILKAFRIFKMHFKMYIEENEVDIIYITSTIKHKIVAPNSFYTA